LRNSAFEGSTRPLYNRFPASDTPPPKLQPSQIGEPGTFIAADGFAFQSKNIPGESFMRHFSSQPFRFCLVLGLGFALGHLALQPDKPRVAKQTERSQVIILATVMEKEMPDHCLVTPPPLGDAAQLEEKGAPAKKILACS
jgi:hypothetical protein